MYESTIMLLKKILTAVGNVQGSILRSDNTYWCKVFGSNLSTTNGLNRYNFLQNSELNTSSYGENFTYEVINNKNYLHLVFFNKTFDKDYMDFNYFFLLYCPSQYTKSTMYKNSKK